MSLWHKIHGNLMIYAPLSQNIVLKIYALFPQMLWDWKADSANFSTFRMYGLTVSKSIKVIVKLQAFSPIRWHRIMVLSLMWYIHSRTHICNLISIGQCLYKTWSDGQVIIIWWKITSPLACHGRHSILPAARKRDIEVDVEVRLLVVGADPLLLLALAHHCLLDAACSPICALELKMLYLTGRARRENKTCRERTEGGEAASKTVGWSWLLLEDGLPQHFYFCHYTFFIFATTLPLFLP